jgi:hypothetical protein
MQNAAVPTSSYELSIAVVVQRCFARGGNSSFGVQVKEDA